MIPGRVFASKADWGRGLPPMVVPDGVTTSSLMKPNEKLGNCRHSPYGPTPTYWLLCGDTHGSSATRAGLNQNLSDGVSCLRGGRGRPDQSETCEGTRQARDLHALPLLPSPLARRGNDQYRHARSWQMTMMRRHCLPTYLDLASVRQADLRSRGWERRG